MSEEDNKRVELDIEKNGDLTPAAAQYKQAYEKLKAESVSKEDYDKVVKENAMLAKNNLEFKPDVDEPKDYGKENKTLRKSLFTEEVEELTNLEYWKKTLKLRKNIIEETGKDPFVPKENASELDINRAEKVAAVVQECIDQCGNSPSMFDALLQSVTEGPMK